MGEAPVAVKVSSAHGPTTPSYTVQYGPAANRAVAAAAASPAMTFWA
jgi:hypothetical protein